MIDTNGHGDLPSGWVLATLEDCVDILDGKRTPINSEDRDKRIAGKSFSDLVPYYGATGQVGWIDDHLFNEELVLLGEDGAPFLDPSRDKAYIIKGESWVNNHAHVLRALGQLTSNKFLCYYLNGFDFHGYVAGTTRLKLNQSPMRRIPIRLPPLPEQSRIVAKIEELLTKLDAGVAGLRKAQTQSKRYRQSVLKAGVTGELTKQWREAHQNELEPASQLLTRILKERRQRWEADQLKQFKAAGKKPKSEEWKRKFEEPPQGYSDHLGPLPSKWTYSSLAPLLSYEKKRGMRTGPFGSLLKKHEHQIEGIPVLGIENIGSLRFIRGSKIHITRKKYQQLSQYRACEGDVLISRSGTVGEVCVVPEGLGDTIISTNLMRVSLAPEGLSPDYFCLLFNGSPFVLSQVSELCKGSTRDFLNQQILSAMIFPMPPLTEQKIIIEEVDRLFSIADAMEQAIVQSLKQAERMRQSILKKVFEGKLVPQDPNEEPAELLLDRIKQERARREDEKRTASKTSRRRLGKKQNKRMGGAAA